MSDGTDAVSVPDSHDRTRVQRDDDGSFGAPASWSEEDAQVRAWVRAQDGSRSDHLSRLLGDVEVLTRLQASDFADEDWFPAAEEFARYGVGVLTAWIGTRAIFGKVKARTSHTLESPPEGALDEDAVHDLATDTVVVALRTFRDDVLRMRRWDPRKGASLKTFFIGQCLFRFPNIYRSWLRDRRRHLAVTASADVAQFERALGSAPGAHALPMQLASIQELLGLLSVDAARRAALMQSAGYTQEEIAAELGLADAKAVENMLGYQRRRLQQQGSGGRRGRGAP
jgi:DNA-directed RNA polymerase specialized sigma24 family protein